MEFEKIFTPVWDTDIVWEESLMMLYDNEGVAEAPLLFEPIEIISVTDSTGEKVYEQNVDYIIIDGKFQLTENSRIFAFKQEEMLLNEEFEKNVREFISRVIEKNPKCEFLLIATSLPNPILTDPRAKFRGNQHLFKEKLDLIAADPNLKGRVAVADITGMHEYLIEHKRFIDMTSNNVNHPNDFLYRCYANFLAEMLCD